MVIPMISRILSIILIGSLAHTLFAQAAADDGKTAQAEATVYAYRLDYDPFLYSFIFSRRLSVKFAPAAGDPKELPPIASLKNKRYLLLKLAPGSYLFDTRMMHGKLRLDLAAGDVRYLRWDHGEECPTEDPAYGPPTCEGRAAGIYEMASSIGEREITRMKPIGKGDVKDRKLVTIPPK